MFVCCSVSTRVNSQLMLSKRSAMPTLSCEVQIKWQITLATLDVTALNIAVVLTLSREYRQYLCRTYLENFIVVCKRTDTEETRTTTSDYDRQRHDVSR
jgi:hypothetical protein